MPQDNEETYEDGDEIVVEEVVTETIDIREESEMNTGTAGGNGGTVG
jgi:hypothetical protein